MKTKQENDMIDHLSLVYAKTKIEMSGSIWLGVVYDENQTEQRRDPSYKCRLRQKW